MKIILLKDVKGVGRRFEEKEISDGYANNLLLPKGLAVTADKAGRAKAENLKKASESKKASEALKLSSKEAERAKKHAALEAFRNSSKK